MEVCGVSPFPAGMRLFSGNVVAIDSMIPVNWSRALYFN